MYPVERVGHAVVRSEPAGKHQSAVHDLGLASEAVEFLNDVRALLQFCALTSKISHSHRLSVWIDQLNASSDFRQALSHARLPAWACCLPPFDDIGWQPERE